MSTRRQLAATPASLVDTKRCAIYTRKSTTIGLEQEFNSLDAQREACEQYIRSQAALGWQLVLEEYSDGGYSGANIQRPAFQRLMQDVEARKIDIVVVHRVDRLIPLVARFRQADGPLQPRRRRIRERDPKLLDGGCHGPAYAERAHELRRVRARDDRRAHARQDVCGPTEGPVDGRSTRRSATTWSIASWS